MIECKFIFDIIKQVVLNDKYQMFVEIFEGVDFVM